jgi:4-amino-4-deoxy-L-arabinose transferase-like glycosyltransferase
MAFAIGALLIAVVLAIVFSERSWRRTGYDGTPAQLVIGTLPAGAVGCQPHEPLPAGTHAVRIHATPEGAGAVAMRVELREAGRYAGVGAVGTVAAGGTVVAALARPLASAIVAPLCIRNTGGASLALYGAATGPADQLALSAGGKPAGNLVGRVRIDDLSSAHPSPLWPVLGRLPERIATATGSALAPWLTVIGLAAALALTAALLWARGGGVAMRYRRDLLLVAALSTAVGACWAGVTPAFEKTDETAHFAYVQAFAELGHPPTQFADTGLLSGRLTCWYNGLEILHYRFFDEERPPWAASVRHSLDRTCAGLSPRYDGAMYVALQPPAYYALAAGAYKLAGGFALPTQLLFARLVSVLLMAMTAAMTFLLVRELIPESLWPARAAALALVLQPVFVFNESGVNPDALNVAVATAIALLGARAWRKGLTARRALALGAVIGVGLVGKTNFLALLPGVLLLATALWWGAKPGGRALRAGRLAGAGVLAAAIFGVYALVNDLAWHRGLTYRDVGYGGSGGSLHRLLEFGWQFFLPRFGSMRNLVGTPGIPFVELIESSTTRLGWWNDYGLASGWTAVLMAIGVLVAIAAVAYMRPRVQRRPWPALVAFGCALLFLAALVWSGYEFSLASGVDDLMPRHALPLMCLWGVIVGCAVAAVPTRWRATATGVLASVFLAHTVLALTTTVSRFYL